MVRRFVILASIVLCGGVRAGSYYVSPSGNDANDGIGPEPGRALCTVQAGVGKLKPGDTLLLRGGVYCVRETIKLGAELSGSAEQPTLIRAYAEERPILIGGVAVTAFVPHGGYILKADLSAHGLTGVRFKQLFFDGKRQVLARYPDFDPAEPITGGWAYVDTEPPPTAAVEAVGAKRVLRCRASDVRRWADPTQGQVFIFPSHEWWNNIVPIASADPVTRVITLSRNCSYEIKPEDRYFVMGLMEELDAPGEWCIDVKGEFVHFWPPAPLAGKPLYVPTTRTILQLAGVRYVTVRGLTFQYCDGTAVQVQDSENCLIAGCTMRNTGDDHGSGVSVSGGRSNGVVGCDIHDVGNAGIALSGGDQTTLTAAGNYAENNQITRTGVFYKQGSGISVHGVGNRVSRNTIHHVPRWAVGFGGNNNIIELNHMHHVSLETSDTGAIYGGSLNWLSAHGTVIRYNYIHDAIGCGRRNGEWRAPFYAWGIYLDWTAMGVTVHGNIIARAPRAGIMVHDGRFNTIENNIIVDCGSGQFDSGGQIEFSGWHVDHFYWTRGMGFGWVKQYESVAEQPVWHREGSTLRDPRTTALADGRTMHSNVVRRNILCYRERSAQAFRFRNVSFEHNPSDRNLVWHLGNPVRTGLCRVKETTGPNLVSNAGFEDGAANAVPADWSGRIPWEQCTVEAVTDTVHSGERSLRLRGVASPALVDKPSWERQVAARSAFISTVMPGRHYRFAVWMKAGGDGTRVRLEALSYKGGAYDIRPGRSEVTVGTEWREVDVAFRFPAVGDGNYRAGIDTTFYVRVILCQDEGVLWIDDAELRAATLADEWEAWQSEGMDRNSIVADPLFVDPANDDYRLRPESPAWALGFKPIPVEDIGCYEDELRASWPLELGAQR